MNVYGIGPKNAFSCHCSTQSKNREKAGMNLLVKQQIAARIEVNSGERTQHKHHARGLGRGVSGLLDEGHFQGVANIKLRMNFHAEMRSVNITEVNNALKTESDGLITGVNEQMNDIGQEFDLASEVEEIFSAFSSAVLDLFGGNEKEQAKPASIITGIQDAFSRMFASLQQMTPTEVDESDSVTAESDTALTEIADDYEMVESANENDAAAYQVATEPVGNMFAFSAGYELGSNSGAEQLSTRFNDVLNELQDWFVNQMDAMQTAISEISDSSSSREMRGEKVAFGNYFAMYSDFNVMNITQPASITDEIEIETT